MGEKRSTSPLRHLDLNNFDSAAAERSRFVLTSPRSLQSCAHMGVKPVQLLIKSLNESRAEQQGASFEAVRVMHESYEKERRRLLQMCRGEREKLVQAGGGRPGSPAGTTTVAGLKTTSRRKVEDDSVAHGGPIVYADLCNKGKPVSRSSCSVAGNIDLDGSTVGSVSRGDLRRSSAVEVTLERLAKDIKKEMCVAIPERDRKIAALMLARHQEERGRLELRFKEDQEQHQAHVEGELQRAEAERQRRKKLKQSMQHWREELETRRRLRECQEKVKAGQLHQDMQLQEERWRRVKEEVEAYRRGKLEAAQRDSEERKQHQERLLRHKEEVEKRVQEKERRVATEREQKARKKKQQQEETERRRLREENHRQLLRRLLMKRQTEQQAEEAEDWKRRTLEKRLQTSGKKRVEVLEARTREMQERATQEEEQIRRAQLRATLHSVQEVKKKGILLERSQRRTESAARRASARSRSRAQQAQRHNRHRQLRHQELRQRLEAEEEATRKVRESCIDAKERRRERLRRQREQIQEEAQRLTRACFHMRDRVRQLTFDPKALEAQLTASMSHMTLS